MQTQIRLLLEEQSDQRLHYLLFHLHVFDQIPSGLASLFEFFGELQQSFLLASKKELYGTFGFAYYRPVHHFAFYPISFFLFDIFEIFFHFN